MRHIRLPLKPVPPYSLPLQGILGLALVGVAWPVSWLQIRPLSEYTFFPLWLGYILIIDALVLRRKETSLLVRNPKASLPRLEAIGIIPAT